MATRVNLTRIAVLHDARKDKRDYSGVFLHITFIWCQHLVYHSSENVFDRKLESQIYPNRNSNTRTAVRGV